MYYLFISCSDKTHLADRCIKNQIFSENYDSISVDIRFIGYACPECPQYNIEKVYYSENKEEYFYFNKEIYINILDKELQNQIPHRLFAQRTHSHHTSKIRQTIAQQQSQEHFRSRL